MESQANYSIEQRVSLSLAVGRYLQSSERFQEVSTDFTKACKELRNKLGKDSRFVIQVDFKHYIVSRAADGNFEVDPIQSL